LNAEEERRPLEQTSRSYTYMTSGWGNDDIIREQQQDVEAEDDDVDDGQLSRRSVKSGDGDRHSHQSNFSRSRDEWNRSSAPVFDRHTLQADGNEERRQEQTHGCVWDSGVTRETAEKR